MASKFNISGKYFDELGKYLSSFKGKNDAVRITTSKSGVEFRFTEDGILGSCKLPIIATGSDDIYVKFSVLSNILSASINKIVDFDIRDENLIQVNIDGVNINISPEFFNGVAFFVPDLDNPEEELTISADILKDTVKKVSTQSSADSQTTPVMKIGAQWRYGTSVNITLMDSKEFAKVNWNVSSTFIKFISAITKLDQDVQFMHIHGEYENYLVITCGYTTFWTTMAGIEPVDITEFMEQDVSSVSSWTNSKFVMQSLEKLYIPLIGSVDEPHVIVTIGADKTKLLVTDLANRISFDVLEHEGQVAYDEPVELNFHAIFNVMKKLNSSLPFKVTVKETCMIFTQGTTGEDSLTCLISRYIA